MPPAELRARVLDASKRARPFGSTVPDIPLISPAAAFGRAVDAMELTLRSLSHADWCRPAIRDLDVQGLVGHLIGVEDAVQRAIERDPSVADVDHVASTQPAAVRQAGRLPALTLDDWHGSASRTLALVASQPGLDEVIAIFGVRLPLSAVLIFRAFELWTHENDIRLAAGLPRSAPDPSVLRLMTGLAVSLVPFAALGSGILGPAMVRLVLTGPGGGTWDLPIGIDPGQDPDGAHPGKETSRASVVTDVVDWCRLAANRTRPAELDVYLTGDTELATELLAATATLGLD
jgi:uncharacterized protein (TIGR03083 family)